MERKTEMTTLKYSNNWQADIYTVDGKTVKTLESVKIDGKLYGVNARNISIPYNDMGRTYYGTSTHYFVTTKIFSLSREIDLNTVVKDLQITPVKYTTE